MYTTTRFAPADISPPRPRRNGSRSLGYYDSEGGTTPMRIDTDAQQQIVFASPWQHDHRGGGSARVRIREQEWIFTDAAELDCFLSGGRNAWHDLQRARAEANAADEEVAADD